MDRYRFYVPNLAAPPLPGALDLELALPEGEAHHARSVLRLTAGEEVVLFDGAGRWAPGRIASVKKGGVGVCRLAVPVMEAAPTPALTLATAIPKGERAQWLVEQASQLNVTAVQFLDCERSVAKVEGGRKLEKWRRLAIESAKQCGRAHVLEIREPAKLTDMRRLEGDANRVLWLDPGPDGTSVGAALAGWSGGVLALIGPEGGWSPGERKVLAAAVESGWVRRVRLTRTVLRIETACAALAAIVMRR